MVKSELIQKLSNIYPNLLHRDLEKAVDVVFDEIINSMIKGKRCEIRNFGTFKTKVRVAREARNPKTGDKIMIDEKKVPVFKMSKQIQLKLNNEN